MAEPSLLGHLVQRIGRAEYLATESLGFILVRSEPCRSTVRDLAARCGAAVDEGLVYRTQVSGDDKAFPDVEGGPAGGDPQVILEGKFSAGLTDNQPRTYLRRLMPLADGILLFVVPARRFMALWPEIRARCSDDGIEAHDGVNEKELRAARTSSGHIIAMISWRELLGRMSGAVAAAGEVRVGEDIAQLAGLCDLQDLGVFTPILREELDDLSVSRRMRDYYQLPKDIIAAAVRASFATKGNLTEGFSPPRYANYFSLGTRGAYLSIDPDLWARYEWGPLWFGFQDGWWHAIRRDQWPRMVTKLGSLGTQSNDPLNRSLLLVTPPDGRSIIGVQLSVGVERERVIEDAVARLRRIHELLEGWPLSEPSAAQQVV